jgi:predicted RNA-binding Zn ribbon-like protein
MTVTNPTAATTRLDGGHPALELLNTVYAPPSLGPVEHDMLRTPEDLAIWAARVGMAEAGALSSPRALRAARALRATADPVLRAIAEDRAPPPDALAGLEHAARRALAAAALAPAATPSNPAATPIGWTWPADDPTTPVHRLALATVELLGDAGELARLRRCDACCWLYLDHSRGRGRRWCSMADCGGEAKKRRYVETRRARRAAARG